MRRLSHFFFCKVIVFFCSVVTYAGQDDYAERVYIKTPLQIDPGTSDKNICFTLSLDAENTEEPFVGFQMDIVLPEGLSVEYTKAGKPRITLCKPGVYPSYTDYDDEGEEISVYPHSLNINEVGGAIRVIVYSANPDADLRYFTKKSGDLLKVYVRPSAYLKPGDVDVYLRNVTFGRNDATGNTIKQVSLQGITANSATTIPIKVSAGNKFGTTILPFDVQEIPAGLGVYSCNQTDNEYIVLKKQNEIKAYIPYILYAPNGFDGKLSGEADEARYCEMASDGYLCGTVVTRQIGTDGGNYVMQNKGDGVMFYRVADASFTILPGKCWLTLPQSSHASARFRFGDSTKIEELKIGNQSADVFDLSGRSISLGTEHGIYIVDKKKVIK